MTTIQTLYDFLSENGMFDDWTGPDGTTQSAPEVQRGYYDEEAVESNKRIFLIRQVSSGGGTRFASSPTFVFACAGKVNESPVFAETYLNLIYDILLEFTYRDCVSAIDPLGAVNGPMKQASGRFVYDSEWMVKSDNGII